MSSGRPPGAADIRPSGLEQLSHPPLGPALTPSAYYLLRDLKAHLPGCQSENDEGLTEATEACSDQQKDDLCTVLASRA